MEFKNKYSINTEEFFEVLDGDGKIIETIPKSVVSEDCFALGDIISDLIIKLEHIRTT